MTSRPLKNGLKLRLAGARRIVALAVCACLLALVGCGQDKKPGPPARAVHTIRIAGAADVYPVVRALAAQFEKDNPGTRVVFAPARDRRLWLSLGETDLGLIARPLRPEEKTSELTYLHLAHDAIAFATHAGTGVRGVTRAQLRSIYTGRIRNWRELGGRDQPIVPVDYRPGSVLREIVAREVFGGELRVPSGAIQVERVDQMLTVLANTPGAIGYVSLGNAILSGRRIDFLTLDGVRPSIEEMRRGNYPLSRPFGFLLGPAPERTTMRFVRFTYSEQGRRVIEAHGFAPVTMDLVVGVPPARDLLVEQQRYGPLIEYLRRSLGVQITVELRLLPSYGDVLDEFRAGRVNAAFLGALGLVLARAQLGVEPVAECVRSDQADDRGVIVVHRAGWNGDLDGLRGRRFGFVDRGSAAGYLFPLVYFRERGVDDPARFFGRVFYAGSHDLLFQEVARGGLDGGAGRESVLRELTAEQPRLAKTIAVIARSGPLPGETFVLAPNLKFPCFKCHDLVPSERLKTSLRLPRQPKDLKTLLSQLLLGLHDSPEGASVLAALGAERFVEPDPARWRSVLELLERAGINPEQYHP